MEQNATHSEYSKDGNIHKVQMGVPDAPATPAPAAPVHRQGGITYRYDMVKGEMSTSSPKIVTITAPKAEAFALNAQGTAVDLSEASASSVITIPGKGDSTAAAWVAAGMLKRAPNGQGYVLAGDAARATAPNAQQQQQKPQDQPTVEQTVTAADLANVQGTSDADEAVLRDVQEGAPAQFEGMIEAAARGSEINYDNIAREVGVEGGAGIEQMVAAHRNAGIQVLRNIDSTIDPLAFEAYVQKDPDLASNIIRGMLKKDPSALVKAGRAYVADRTNRIERKVIGMGIDTKRGNDGTLYIARSAVGLEPTPKRGDFPADNFISLKEAQRLGLVTING